MTPSHLLPLLHLTNSLLPSSYAHDLSPKVAFLNNVHNTLSHRNENPKQRKSHTSSVCFLSKREEEEWHPFDSANTTPQLLSSLWTIIVKGRTMTKGEAMTVTFPEMLSSLTRDYVERLMGHLDVCKDVCDDFGVNLVLTPYTVSKMGRDTITGFTVKSYKSTNKIGTLPTDGDFNFAYDPLWDDDEDWSNIEANIEAEVAGFDELESKSEGENELVEIENRIPDDDEEIIEVTKKWVKKMMSDMGICPFTSGGEMAGLPLGKVFYTIDRSISAEEMYKQYWKEVVRVEQTPEKELSTTLMIAPNFFIDNVELFENFSNSLTQPLESLNVEDLLQLVFFHPKWSFRDGGDRTGMDAAANYARRSPWPMINILRTNQVRAAQRGIPTGLVYKQNEKTLNSVGGEKLEKMLRSRNWAEIEGMKVDRQDREVLRVAQDLQKTGIVTDRDTSFANDSTVAANKVDSKEIEGGNMVNVLMQALGKRLTGSEGGGTEQLSGAETSVAMMANDFILDYFKELQKNPQLALEDNKKQSLAKDFFDDVSQTNKVDDEINVLFGGGGIQMETHEDYNAGMDPANFY